MFHRLKAAALAAALSLISGPASAQTSPGWAFGYTPTAAEWNTFLAAKADYAGSPPITAAGGVFTGKINFAASSASTAGMNCGVGTAPSSPVNGDLWCTTTGVFARINGSTIALGTSGGTLAVTGGGTGVATFTAGQPILGNGTSALTQGTVSGTGTQFGTVTGAKTSGDCLSFDASGNIHSAGVGACGGTGGAGTVASASAGQLAIYTAATTVSGLAGCNNGYFGTNGGGTVSCITTVNTTLSGTITALGTIATGVWQGTLVAGQYGGTGVANTGSTITLGGNNFAISGAAVTLTAIGATNVTLPTTGTLLNQNGTSGGIPYYNSSTTVQSSGALTANVPVIGGGAGAAPSSGTRSGTTTTFATTTGTVTGITGHCASFDNVGNLQDSTQACGGANATPVLLATISGGGTSYTDVGQPNCASGCFTATYPSYTLRFINIVAATPATNLLCLIQVYSGAAYQNAGYVSSDSRTTGISCGGEGNGATSGFAAPGISGTVMVANPSAAAKAQFTGLLTVTTTSAPFATFAIAAGQWNTNGVVTGFRVFFGTTNVPTVNIGSGTIEVYGNP